MENIKTFTSVEKVRNYLLESDLKEIKKNQFTFKGKYFGEVGEYSKPIFSVRKLKNQNLYGIYQKVFFHKPRKNNFLSKYDCEYFDDIRRINNER